MVTYSKLLQLLKCNVPIWHEIKTPLAYPRYLLCIIYTLRDVNCCRDLAAIIFRRFINFVH